MRDSLPWREFQRKPSLAKSAQHSSFRREKKRERLITSERRVVAIQATTRLSFIQCHVDFGAEGGTRTPTSYLTRPSNVRVYQFRHFGFSIRAQSIVKQLLAGCWRGSRVRAARRRCGRLRWRRGCVRAFLRRTCCGRCSRWSLRRGRWLRFLFIDRLQHGTLSGDGWQRKRNGDEHEERSRADSDFRQQGLCAARSESCAGDAAGEKSARVGLARLQEHGDYQHDARQNKKYVKSFVQLTVLKLYLL